MLGFRHLQKCSVVMLNTCNNLCQLNLLRFFLNFPLLTVITVITNYNGRMRDTHLQYSKWNKIAKGQFPFCHFMALLSKNTKHSDFQYDLIIPDTPTKIIMFVCFLCICVYSGNVLACSLRSPVKQTPKI